MIMENLSPSPVSVTTPTIIPAVAQVAAASMREGSMNLSATAAVSARGYRKADVIAHALIRRKPDPSLTKGNLNSGFLAHANIELTQFIAGIVNGPPSLLKLRGVVSVEFGKP